MGSYVNVVGGGDQVPDGLLVIVTAVVGGVAVVGVHSKEPGVRGRVKVLADDVPLLADDTSDLLTDLERKERDNMFQNLINAEGALLG